MSNNRNLDTSKLNELLTLKQRVADLTEYIGTTSVPLGKGKYAPGSGVKGEFDKLKGLMLWAAKDEGRAQLTAQAKKDNKPVMDYIISWKLVRQRKSAALLAEIKELTTMLEAAETALENWEADNPDYKDLDIDFITSMLSDEPPTDTRITEDLQTIHATEETETSILSRILNSKI